MGTKFRKPGWLAGMKANEPTTPSGQLGLRGRDGNSYNRREILGKDNTRIMQIHTRPCRDQSPIALLAGAHFIFSCLDAMEKGEEAGEAE
jgi:hypothetical protein